MVKRASSEVVSATKAYIQQYPYLGKEKIREYVKKQYNTAPSNKAILDLKKEVWGLSPNVCYRGWRAAGFTKQEATELVKGSKGVKVNWTAVYNSEAGIRARASRLNYINKQLGAGRSPKQIEKMINDHYNLPNTNPFEHIQAEYIPKPPKKIDFIDYDKRDRAKVKQDLLYGRKRR